MALMDAVQVLCVKEVVVAERVVAALRSVTPFSNKIVSIYQNCEFVL